MKNFSHNFSLILSIALYAILCWVLHPLLGYLLDSDGIAYLTIAKRFANSHYLESVNGLWSPLNSWLLAPFIQHGYDAWQSAKVLNCFLGGIILIQSWDLFRFFKLDKIAINVCMIALSIVMVHAVYLQMFGDVLQLIFALAFIRIICLPNYLNSIPLLITSASIMGIGFYAKVYSFPFFVLVSFGILCWQVYQKIITVKKAIQRFVIGVGIILLFVLPWSFALHQKYHEWTLTGFAGKMNMSWQINSGKTFRSDIQLLIPPSSQDSPSFWEDPYPTQVNLSSPTSSLHHFIKWIARIVHTSLNAITCFNEISFFSIVILLFSAIILLRRNYQDELGPNKNAISILFIIGLLLPLGYLMMHIETRYIWLEQFIIMILGSLFISNSTFLNERKIKLFMWIALAASFIVFPILDIKNLKGKNQDLFEAAHELEQHHIKGSFTSNATDAGRMWVIAYLSQNPFYTIERSDYSYAELITEMKRYQVKYYLFQSENNKPQLNLPNEFRFCFKGNGYDMYELIE